MMKYSTRYPITAAQINAQYRLTIDGMLTFHENTVARYFTTLGLDKKVWKWIGIGVVILLLLSLL